MGVGLCHVERLATLVLEHKAEHNVDVFDVPRGSFERASSVVAPRFFPKHQSDYSIYPWSKPILWLMHSHEAEAWIPDGGARR